ncbi:MAG TPA: hypothetical protein VFK89_07835 [Actinomycetota bacterium]|nr:hypothetical protein [Actinomycetota bacterium]
MKGMRRPAVAALAIALIVSVACSGTETPSSSGTGTGTPTVAEGGGREHHDDHGGMDHGSRSSRGHHDGGHGRDDGTMRGGTGGARHGGSGPGDPQQGGSRDAGSGSAAAAYPAAGHYVYEQAGSEEFCSATDCDRRPLPRQQPVDISYQRRDEDSATVVVEQHASGNRVMRTTATFDRERSSITKVYVHFSYEGVSFENTYVPDPPVEALRFPLTSGSRWSGTWKADTSGSYSIEVGDREPVATGAGEVDAFKVVTDTEFHGQFDGRSRVTAWIDPRTEAIVKTNGALNVTSSFGRYSTVFRTQLESAPGYQ